MSASLLPPNATPLMRAIEQVTAQRLAALPVDTIRSLWDAETCPVEWLPLLAWGESADYWDTAWSESRRRAYVAALRAIHERKGTLGAVRDILAAVGHADATVEEHLHRWTLDGSVTLDGWHSLGQGWARYLVRLARPVPNRIAQALRRLLRLTAPAHMRLVVLDYTAAAWRLDGTVTLDGAYNLGSRLMYDRPDAEFIDDSAATWVTAVYKLLADDPGSGGDEGALTRPHIEHALRAAYLRDRVDATDATAAAHLVAADPHGDRAYADSLLAALPASQGEVDAGVEALRAVTPATLAGYIGPRTTIDPAGITRLLGGLQLRFGAIPAIAANTVSPAYAFAPAFPTECLALIPVAYSAVASAAVSLSRYSVSAAQFQVHNPSTTTVAGWYLAIGR